MEDLLVDVLKILHDFLKFVLQQPPPQLLDPQLLNQLPILISNLFKSLVLLVSAGFGVVCRYVNRKVIV